MPTWRSVHVGTLDLEVSISSTRTFPRELHGRGQTGQAVASTPFVRLVVSFPRRWEQLSQEEQEARLKERW